MSAKYELANSNEKKTIFNSEKAGKIMAGLLLAGPNVVTLEFPIYAEDMFIINAISMLVTSLLFLGRESFCMSKVAKSINQPAHIVFGRESYGIGLAFLTGTATIGISLAGFFLSLEGFLTIKVGVCHSIVTSELVCNELPPFVEGLPVCITNNLKLFLSAIFAMMYGYAGLISAFMFPHLRRAYLSTD